MEDDEADRLRREQQHKAETERELAGESLDETEAQTHERRADKADYLKRKLQERKASEEG